MVNVVPVDTLRWIVLFPALGFLWNLFLGPARSPASAKLVGPGVLLAAFVASVLARAPAARRCRRTSALHDVGLPVDPRRARSHVDVAFWLDPLSAVMVLVVTGVGFLIHVYSVGYMAHDPDVAALLHLPEPLHHRDADPRARRQPAAAVRRLGGRRALLLPADRLLVDQGRELHRRQEGVARQPRRRRLLPARALPARSSSPGRSTSPASQQQPGRAAHRRRSAAGPCRPLVCLLLLRRRHRQVGADPALRLAARRHGRPHAGVGADPRRHHGDGRRLPDLPPARALRAGARRARRRRRRRRGDRALRRHHRGRADRHQEGARLLHGEPARLHVPRRRRRAVRARRSSTW